MNFLYSGKMEHTFRNESGFYLSTRKFQSHFKADTITTICEKKAFEFQILMEICNCILGKP